MRDYLQKDSGIPRKTGVPPGRAITFCNSGLGQEATETHQG
jgi:hypothetical protein